MDLPTIRPRSFSGHGRDLSGKRLLGEDGIGNDVSAVFCQNGFRFGPRLSPVANVFRQKSAIGFHGAVVGPAGKAFSDPLISQAVRTGPDQQGRCGNA